MDLRRQLAFKPVGDEGELVARLRAGEEDAFVTLVAMYQARLLRLAGTVVASRAVAEEVVQDTWLAVVRASTARRPIVVQDVAVPHPAEPGPNDGWS